MVGEIISEWRATSNRNGGRHHSGTVGEIERNQQSVHETGLTMRDALFLLQHRLDSSMPTRDELLTEARAMFAKTRYLDDIVDRAHELLVESVCLLLIISPELAVSIEPRGPQPPPVRPKPG
jgi:hypothetical protein